MKCNKENILFYIDDLLDENEKVMMEKHLKECICCYKLYKEICEKNKFQKESLINELDRKLSKRIQASKVATYKKITGKSSNQIYEYIAVAAILIMMFGYYFSYNISIRKYFIKSDQIFINNTIRLTQKLLIKK